MGAPLDIVPNWKDRSTIVMAPGLWMMRNGSVARVKKQLQLPYTETATKAKKVFLVWSGNCECCNSYLTWNENGTHAANGMHPFDIVGKAE